jgi:CheY-like chemotaxis protein
MLLRRLEYRVTTARSGKDALQQLERALPGIVILASGLPDMDCAAFLKVLQDDPRFRGLPVIVLTAGEDPALKSAIQRFDCVACLPRTFDPDELYRVIQARTESAPRQHIRLATSLSIIVGDGTAMGGTERAEQATAISEGGLFVKTRYPQPQNAVTPIRFTVGGAEIRTKAVVLYSGPEGMGMKFTDISAAGQDLIRVFIKDQLTKDIAH